MNMAFVSQLAPEPFGQMFPMSFGSKLKQTKVRCHDVEWERAMWKPDLPIRP